MYLSVQRIWLAQYIAINARLSHFEKHNLSQLTNRLDSEIPT